MNLPCVEYAMQSPVFRGPQPQTRLSAFWFCSQHSSLSRFNKLKALCLSKGSQLLGNSYRFLPVTGKPRFAAEDESFRPSTPRFALK